MTDNALIIASDWPIVLHRDTKRVLFAAVARDDFLKTVMVTCRNRASSQNCNELLSKNCRCFR